MAMLDRYKKKGGFIQLLCLIESSNRQKQEQFLSLIAQENQVWEEAVRKKSLTLDRILTWNPVYMGEVLTRIQPLTLATALRSLSKEQGETVLGCIGITDRRKIQQVIDESNPTASEISSCVLKMIQETRGFIQSGILKMDKVDPELLIPDNIEEQLESKAVQRLLADDLSKVGSPKLEAAPDAKVDPKAETKGKSEGRTEQNREELEFLKKKVNQLVTENAGLKQEIAVLRGKLEQIKRIA